MPSNSGNIVLGRLSLKNRSTGRGKCHCLACDAKVKITPFQALGVRDWDVDLAALLLEEGTNNCISDTVLYNDRELNIRGCCVQRFKMET